VLLVLSTFVGAMIVPPLHGVLPATTELEHGRVVTLKLPPVLSLSRGSC
jgi:NADH-quinone oxidoreductase subunit L